MSSLTFTSLLNMYEGCHGRVYMAMSANRPLFVSQNWICRLFYRLFMGYSFTLTRCAQTVLLQACDLLHTPIEQIPSGELGAMLKVVGVATRLLGHARQKRGQECWQALDTVGGAIGDVVEKASAAIAKRQNVAEVQVLLEAGCAQKAYAHIQRDGFPKSVPAELLTSLVRIGDEQHNIHFLVELAHRMVSMRELATDQIKIAIAHAACEKGDDLALACMAESASVVAQQANLFLAAAKKGLKESLKVFLAKKRINPNVSDEAGNTALHHAFVAGREDVIEVLLPHCNAIAKNKMGHTPLLEASYAQSTVNPLTLLTRKNEEVQGVVTRSRSFTRALQQLVPCDVSTPCDIVELTFLLDTPAMTTALMKEVYREDFEQAIDYLKLKYPKSVLSPLYMAQFVLDKSHFETGYQFFNIPEKVPGNHSLNELFDLFRALPWNRIDAPSILNEVRGRSLAATPPEAKAELHHDLNVFIQRVLYRLFFSGMPVEKNEREHVYRQIELALKHTIDRLKAINSTETTLSVLKEIMKASNLCGPVYFDTSMELYLRMCLHIEVTPRFTLEQRIARYRRICLEGVVSNLYVQDVHAWTHSMHDLGKELGIPGCDHTISDPCASEGYDKEAVRKRFFEVYTPNSILFDLIFPLLQSDGRARFQYFDLQKDVMPSSWNEERFGPILAELGTITEDRRIKELFDRHAIDRHTNKTPEEDVLHARYLDYLANFVYDGSQFRHKALVYALERIGVFTSVLPCRDRSKQVVPLRVEEPTRSVTQKATGFLKRMFWWQ